MFDPVESEHAAMRYTALHNGETASMEQKFEASTPGGVGQKVPTYAELLGAPTAIDNVLKKQRQENYVYQESMPTQQKFFDMEPLPAPYIPGPYDKYGNGQ